MKCILCGQMNVDGTLDQNGDYICVDCWVLGEADYEGRSASVAIEADSPFSGNCSAHTSFLEACNRRKNDSKRE